MERKISNEYYGLEDESIKERYQIYYTPKDDSFYKHIDELLVADENLGDIYIKSTLGRIDLTINLSNGAVVDIIRDNRIDLLATKHYAKASMWRAIAYANNMSDPLKNKGEQPLIIPNEAGLRIFPNPLS